MRRSSKFLPWLTLLVGFAVGCGEKQDLINNPFMPAQIQVQLAFPDLSGGSSRSGLSTQAIDNVEVSVIDVFTREVIVRLQQLEIVPDPLLGTNVAQGDLSIPITGDLQSFQILVFATDIASSVFLSGASNLSLTPGEIRQVPVFIQLRAPTPISGSGTATASSLYQGGAFPAEFGVDLAFGTSWFSGGSVADGDTSTYTWTAGSDLFIAACAIFNNSENDNLSFRNGFGFGKVVFQVYSGPNATGTVLFQETVDYPRTAALPAVEVAPLITGRSIHLKLSGHENPDRAGFSELLIISN